MLCNVLRHVVSAFFFLYALEFNPSQMMSMGGCNYDSAINVWPIHIPNIKIENFSKLEFQKGHFFSSDFWKFHFNKIPSQAGSTYVIRAKLAVHISAGSSPGNLLVCQ